MKQQLETAYQEPTKQQLMEEFNQTVKEISLVNKGKLKARAALELLDELITSALSPSGRSLQK